MQGTTPLLIRYMSSTLILHGEDDSPPKSDSMVLDVPSELISGQGVVTLSVGNKTFTISRPLLNHHSPHLMVLLDDESTMFFPDFADIPNIFEQCLNLLKGDKVEVTLKDFKGFLKFGILYKVFTLYGKLLDLLTTEFKGGRITFVKLHEFALLAISFNPMRCEILHQCQGLLTKQGLFIIEKELQLLPENTFDNNFVKLLVNENYIWSTLPFLQKLLTNQAKAEMILPILNTTPILNTLKSNTAFTDSFLSHLRSLLVDSDSKHLLLLIKIQESLMKANNQKPHTPLLSNYEFCVTPKRKAEFMSLSAQDFLKRGHRHNFHSFVYCELLLEWLKARADTIGKKNQFIQKVWAQIDLSYISKGFMHDLKLNFDKLCQGEKLVLPLPSKDLLTHNYHGFGFHLTNHQTYSLLLGNPVALQHHCGVLECEEESEYGLCLQLVDNTPCYATRAVLLPPHTHIHAAPIHWWLSLEGSDIISLVTNSMKDIMDKLSSTPRVYVSCAVQGNENPVVNFS